MGLGSTEIFIIAGVVILLFGAGAIPKFAKSIGKAKKEFEKGVKESSDDDDAPAKKKSEDED
jgi:sec-independent protein translocase protein TatA